MGLLSFASANEVPSGPREVEIEFKNVEIIVCCDF